MGFKNNNYNQNNSFQNKKSFQKGKPQHYHGAPQSQKVEPSKENMEVTKTHQNQNQHKRKWEQNIQTPVEKTKFRKFNATSDSSSLSFVNKKDKNNSSSMQPVLFDWNYKEHPEVTNLSNEKIQAFFNQHSIQIHSNSSFELKPILEFKHCQLPHLWSDTCFQTFEKPTPIQSVVWPVLFQNKDVIAIAETGSGKTLGFGLPAMVHVLHFIASSSSSSSSLVKRKKNQPYALVLLPTRELAMQVHEVIQALGQPYQVACACLYGGIPKSRHRSLLESMHPPHVIVATPGRLLDLIQDQCLDLSLVSLLILDESDRMLDLGFEKEIQSIVSLLPKQRHTWMFSATWPESIQSLAHSFLNQPVHITLGHVSLNASSTVKQIVQVIDSPNEKMKIFFQLLRSYYYGLTNTNTDTSSSKAYSQKNHSSTSLNQQHPNEKKNSSTPKILVFALYKAETQRVYQQLLNQGYPVVAIHGDLPQSSRTQALNQFKLGEASILVATDVAARGLDIPQVNYVINLTFPLTIEDYVHRIGRTGRAGRSGTAHTLFTINDKAHAGELIQVLKQTNQEVPESLFKFGTTIKKKEHQVYGAFYKDIDKSAKSTKIKFDSDNESS